MDNTSLNLRQVIDLGKTIRMQTTTRAESENFILDQQPPNPEPESNRAPHIGDFTRIWDFLGLSATGGFTAIDPLDLGSLAAESRPGAANPNQATAPDSRKPPKASTVSSCLSRARRLNLWESNLVQKGCCAPEPTAQSPRIADSPAKRRKRVPPLPQPPRILDPTPQPARIVTPNRILSLNLVSSESKDLAIADLLLRNFPRDMASILRPRPDVRMDRVGTASMEFCTHVFLDLSNITIGFLDRLKRTRGIPRETRMPIPPMSFRRLALIMERGRPVAKRVLVGSRLVTDTRAAPEVQQAYDMGWNINILDRVMRVKPNTIDRSRLGTLGDGYGSENPAYWHLRNLASATMSEQGVDEILHLKMMESLIDSATPQIMVLGTGDAAVAEFSGGFIKMVERALVRGWRVELVCFSGNLGHVYTSNAFRNKWGPQLLIIDLSYCAELLLDL
ncbi:MAG: hypothetical protein M1829_006723 [Trizodia sp. TS-e1964]|nr:MAG: hypothetical protein M1829_006723 [Trizodia sp. TS-e1964]